MHKILCKLKFSDICSRLDYQNWSTILLSWTSSPSPLFSFTLWDPLVSQIPSLQSQPCLLQAALPSQGGGHRPPEPAGISFHPTLIRKGCFPLWCHSGSRTAVGHRLQSPGWEGSDHMTALYLWKCRVEGGVGGGGRNKWNVALKKCQADWTTDLYKGACIYCTK